MRASSFFDKSNKTPNFILAKEKHQQLLSRRGLLKSAAGIAAVSVLPTFTLDAKNIQSLEQLSKTDPWLTLHATLHHLLPKSASSTNGITPEDKNGEDISAQSINALLYLYQVMTVQPTVQEEKDFIVKGVGWLNNYAQSEKNGNFVALTTTDKEQLLRGISQSRAGQNWLNTLLGYIFQAMLSPPSYGGNPKGIGWQWLEHQAGFPLPKKGQRYFELPPRASIKNHETIAINTIDVEQDFIKKAPSKRNHKA